MASQHTDEQKVSAAVEKIMKLLNKTKLNIPELLVLYGNLGYHIGASIAGLDSKGPNIEELKRAYYQNPTVDVGLMLQGMLITAWEEDYIKNPRLSSLANNPKGKKE
jgi:hypothetical protein